MNDARKLELKCESLIVDNWFAKLSSRIAGTREVRIQAAKLNRLLGQADLPQRALGDSTKKSRKRQGKLAAKIGQQSRKMRSTVDSCLREAVRQDALQQGIPFSNAEFQEWRQSVNKALKAQVKDTVRQANEELERRLADPSVRAGFARLLERRRRLLRS